MKSILKYLGILPKSLYWNIKAFGFRNGLHLPILFGSNVRLSGVYKGCFQVAEKNKFGSVRLGLTSGSYRHGRGQKSNLVIAPGARVVFGGGINIAQGFSINVGKGAVIELGNNFNSNFNFIMSCAEHISFGDDCLLGWNCTFIDSDGHKIINDGVPINPSAPIKIGQHVWFAANTTALKGTEISADSVIGMGSVLSKAFTESNIVIAGIPARVVKKGINWER